jgi:arylsulfatase A-like enzyme
VHHFDIYATAADAAGIRLNPEHKLDGVSLMPYARADKIQAKPHDTLFWRAGNYRTVRHHDWKMATDPLIGNTWLFNLASDPGESNNVAKENPEVVAKMMALLAAHNAEMVPPLWDTVGASSINVDKHLRQELNPEEDTFIYWSN